MVGYREHTTKKRNQVLTSSDERHVLTGTYVCNRWFKNMVGLIPLARKYVLFNREFRVLVPSRAKLNKQKP